VRYGSLGVLLVGVGFYAVNWAFVQHTVNEWGWTISRAGVATCPVAFVSGISAIASSRAAHRYGQRPFMLIGGIGVLGTCAYLWFAMGEEPSLAVVLVGGSLLGLFSGLVTPAFISTTLLGVPSDQHSVGSSINLMAQRTSATLGIALAITFLAGATAQTGLHHSILVGVVGATAGLVLTFLLNRPSDHGSAVVTSESVGSAAR
jgi:MFS family permease